MSPSEGVALLHIIRIFCVMHANGCSYQRRLSHGKACCHEGCVLREATFQSSSTTPERMIHPKLLREYDMSGRGLRSVC